MMPDKKINDAPDRTHIPTRVPDGTLRRNPVINRYQQNLYEENVENDVHSSRAIELLRLAIGNEISHSSRIMAWDNQRIFGPVPENGDSSEKGDLEAD